MEITRGTFEEAFPAFDEQLRRLVVRPEVEQICDVGGGANPRLSIDEVRGFGLGYTIIDISPTELSKAPVGYSSIVADISTPLTRPDLAGRFDLVFSRLLAEHIRYPTIMHSNIHSLLKPGGTALHFFPTMYDPAFVANRLLPEALTAKLLVKADNGRSGEGRNSKFPAYYRWCRGPSRRQLRRFSGLGFEIERYDCFFGTGYLSLVPGARRVNEVLTKSLTRAGWSATIKFLNLL